MHKQSQNWSEVQYPLKHFYAITLWLTPADPRWPSIPTMHYILVRGSSYQIWWSYGIPSSFIACWPQLTPAWFMKPAMLYTLVRGSSYKTCQPWDILEQFDVWLIQMTYVYDLSPHQCATHIGPTLPTKFGGHMGFLSNLTSGWSLHVLWFQHCALHSGEGFFPPKLVAIGQSVIRKWVTFGPKFELFCNWW